MSVVHLSISDVRNGLRAALDNSMTAGPGQSSDALLGGIFHRAFARLMGGGPEWQWQAAIDEDTLGDANVLSQHIYERLLGPELTAHQKLLEQSGAEVLALWQAAREMSAWVSRLLAVSARSGQIHFDRSSQLWLASTALCLVEQPLVWELRESNWTAAVRVSGIADAIWKNPATGRWCVVEYKIGQAAPVLDLAQACLYHQMLAASGMEEGQLASEAGAMALVSFRPQREEIFFSGERLAETQRTLRAFIGLLANVVPPETTKGEKTGGSAASPEIAHIGKQLVKAFEQYAVQVTLATEPILGPSFIRYFVMPGPGVTVLKIKRLAPEVGLQLGLEQAPMIDIVGGRIAVDLKRDHPEPVLFSSVADQLPALNAPHGSSKVPVGVDLTGKLRLADLSQSSPHLLVAGTAGSGKSEWMRTALAGLLVANTPDTLRLVLIDPKLNAFSELEGSPFLFGEHGLVYPTEHLVSDTLDELIEEMQMRIRRIKDSNSDDLAGHKEKTGESIPRIVCFCDEYADLVSSAAARKQIESRIARLAAKARSSGIHLILATQSPRRDVVTGLIKSNLQGRVCLRVTNSTESRIVLDRVGGEKLLGRGDLLFQDVGDPIRLQAAYLPSVERTAIFRSHGGVGAAQTATR